MSRSVSRAAGRGSAPAVARRPAPARQREPNRVERDDPGSLAAVRQGLHAGLPPRPSSPVNLPRSAMLRRRGDAGQPFAVDTQELERKLRQVTEFQGLGERSIALLAKHARFQRHRAGERLWASGEDATQIAIVTGGLAKLVRPNLEGDPFNYGLFGPGDPIGVPALLDGRRYPTDAVAISQGLEVIRLDASILRQLARKEPAVGNALTALLLRFIDIMRSKIEILSAGFMPRRMQVLMLCLADRFGTWEGDGRVRIPLALTREQIAETIGVRLETVVRELKRWQRSGWIEISTSGYVVDRAVLLGGSAAPEFLDDQATSCRRSG